MNSLMLVNNSKFAPSGSVAYLAYVRLEVPAGEAKNSGFVWVTGKSIIGEYDGVGTNAL